MLEYVNGAISIVVGIVTLITLGINQKEISDSTKRKAICFACLFVFFCAY